jgi:hypothetical protein
MRLKACVALGAMLLVAGTVSAQRPRENVNPNKHPNIAAAQRLVDQAFHKITDAQKANEFDLGGHAEKAKGLLDEANRELKLSAETANRK